MGSIIAAVPRHERSMVRAHAFRLHRLVQRQPGVSARLRRRICVQVAAIAPQLASARLAVLVRYALWAYQLDDRIDAPDADEASVARLRNGVAAVTTPDDARPAVRAPEDPLLVELAHIWRALSRYDRGEALAWFGDALRDTVAAEVEQLRLARSIAASGAVPPPSAERYLELAARTGNYRSFAYALLALVGDPLTGAQLRSIDGALRHAAYAARLANDLHGLTGDRARSGLNVLGLRTASGLAVTPGYVWDATDRHVEAHDLVLTTLTGLGAVPEASTLALTRSLAQVVRLYRHTDLR